MSDYVTSRVWPQDRATNAQVDELLAAEGIKRDPHLDYTCATTDADGRVIATGSCFGNTLRCMAVSSAHQGEGLMNEVVTHLSEVQYERGNLHLFLYTKPTAAKFFGDLGFHEVARARTVVFMERGTRSFDDYLAGLGEPLAGTAGAVVMNANPFTLGHRALVEHAAKDCDVLHLFVVSEDASLFPAAVRKSLVERGIAGLANVHVHETGPYLVSSATFPSYFLADDDAATRGQAELDAAVFGRIAERLRVTRRYLGEEPTSHVTALYNEVLSEHLPPLGVEVFVIERVTAQGSPISASTVRQLIKDGRLEEVRDLVPPSTFDYLTSPAAEPVLAAIRAAGDVVHH